MIDRVESLRWYSVNLFWLQNDYTDPKFFSTKMVPIGQSFAKKRYIFFTYFKVSKTSNNATNKISLHFYNIIWRLVVNQSLNFDLQVKDPRAAFWKYDSVIPSSVFHKIIWEYSKVFPVMIIKAWQLFIKVKADESQTWFLGLRFIFSFHMVSYLVCPIQFDTFHIIACVWDNVITHQQRWKVILNSFSMCVGFWPWK